ncbi:MAG: cell division protein ZapA [Candidatus Latescibacteria bacterium]|nr:cell division protein ZapA [Candidatus Latescibacterota bacterium]
MERKKEKRESVEKEVHTTTLKVFGIEYDISGPEDPAYTRRVAEYVDKKMREIARQSRVLDQSKLAVLVAMDVADELLMLRRKRYAIIGRTGTAAEKLSRTVAVKPEKE